MSCDLPCSPQGQSSLSGAKFMRHRLTESSLTWQHCIHTQKKTRAKRSLASQLCGVRARASSGRREAGKQAGRERQGEEA
jgi:hypothetical protein